MGLSTALRSTPLWRVKCDDPSCGKRIPPGEEFRHNGHYYCCKRHMDYDATLRAERDVRSGGHWMAVVSAFLLIGLLGYAVYPNKTRAHDHHPLHKDFYMHWMQPTNPTMSCCNARIEKDGTETGDCEPTQARLVKGDWYAYIRQTGEWVKIPDEKIIRERNPNIFDAHICYNGNILCFKPPDTGG